MTSANPHSWRKTTQLLLSSENTSSDEHQYRLFPIHEIERGVIDRGYEALATIICNHNVVLIDGYGGVFWDEFRAQLTNHLEQDVRWINVVDAMLSESDIDELVEPFLGGEDPIFGKRTSLILQDFFDTDKLATLSSTPSDGLTIIYGCGASLVNHDGGFLVYLDIPKNEIQYRSRAGKITNLGRAIADHPKRMYKRFYFVDWVVLNHHKAELCAQIDLIVDTQNPDQPTMISGDTFRKNLDKLSSSVFRVRPWFEPGAWGGQWMKAQFQQLPQDVPNYAWSFEMIAPEQGIIFGQSDTWLEVSFDFLMYHNVEAVLGDYAKYFGYEFPIRYDFLDTIEGGNLSVQCHPRPDFMREHFGEHFTQDETYYILECDADATVYLGFQDGVEPEKFRDALEASQREQKSIEITDFVQQFPAKKHDLFLIPNGTIHASGKGSLVLEISATPYIFTFKMYDWMRLDLDGNPRPINIERGMENLYFERQGDIVPEQLISQPQIEQVNADIQVVHLPTHEAHFYSIDRIEMKSGSYIVDTKQSVQILMVVEGEGVIVATEAQETRYNFAETFIIPAATQSFTLRHIGDSEVKIMCAFMKPEWFDREENQWILSR